MRDPASRVIPLPLSTVEANIQDVTTWLHFLGGVEWVGRTPSRDRYMFGVREGRRVHEVPVVVRWHLREHRVSWREENGPPWRGEIRLMAVNGRRTRVELEALSQPRSLLATFSTLVAGRSHDPEEDLARLVDRLSTIPQPFNPARLNPARRIRRGTQTPADAAEPPAAPSEALAEALTEAQTRALTADPGPAMTAEPQPAMTAEPQSASSPEAMEAVPALVRQIAPSRVHPSL